MFGVDPICAHPWYPCYPWLKQAFHSISTCHPPPILEELSFHDVIVVKSRHPLKTLQNLKNRHKILRISDLHWGLKHLTAEAPPLRGSNKFHFSQEIGLARRHEFVWLPTLRHETIEGYHTDAMLVESGTAKKCSIREWIGMTYRLWIPTMAI